jgi:hypothetical protein
MTVAWNILVGWVLAVLVSGGYIVAHSEPTLTPLPKVVAIPTQAEPEPTVTRKPKPKPKPEPKPVTRSTPRDSVWDKIAECESSGDWSNNDTGNNGHYGGLQFSISTWKSVGGPGLPHHQSREVQIKYAKILQARSGWGQWACANARFN